MRVRLFGMIAEKAGTEHLEVNAGSLDELRAVLAQRIQGLDAIRHAIAVDRRIMQSDMALTGNEEIAVLPPFAGG